MLGSSVTAVVACGGDDEAKKHLNDKGNSVWAWLPELKNGAKPDSANVWNEMTPFMSNGKNPEDPSTWNGDVKSKAAIQVLKMLNVSILANASNVFSSSQISSPNLMNYSTLGKSLSTVWTNLKANVDNQIEQQKQSYQQQYGKKWEDKWKKMLKDKYDSSINNYKAYLYASGSDDNATKEITNLLLNNNAGSFNTANSSTLNSQMGTVPTNTATRTTWVTNNPALAREVTLSYTPYLDGNNVNALWAKDEANTISVADVQGAIAAAQTAYTGGEANTNVPIKDYNTTTNKYEATRLGGAPYSNGLVSQYQKFTYQKYFEQEKPLAVSDIDFSYRTDAVPGSDQKGIQNGVQLKDFSPNDQANIQTVLSKLNTDGTTWTDFSKSGFVSGITPTYQKDLLTINSGGSDKSGVNAAGGSINTNYVASVYGSLPKLTQKTKIADNPTDATALLKTIDRTQDATYNPLLATPYNKGKMFTVINVGQAATAVTNEDRVVVYADDSGLHFVHVDGLNAAMTTDVKSGNSDNIASISDYAKDFDNFNYNLLAQPNQKDVWNKPDKNYIDNVTTGTKKYSFNNSIFNNYLRFLVNGSYIHKFHPDATNNQFDIISSVSSFATLDESSSVGNHLWYTWIYDFMNNYFNNLTSTQNKDWLSNFITFFKADSDNNLTPQNDPSWFVNTIANTNSSLTLYPASSFVGNIRKANTAIESGRSTPGSAYPLGTYWSNNANSTLNYLMRIESDVPSTSLFTLFWKGYQNN